MNISSNLYTDLENIEFILHSVHRSHVSTKFETIIFVHVLRSMSGLSMEVACLRITALLVHVPLQDKSGDSAGQAVGPSSRNFSIKRVPRNKKPAWGNRGLTWPYCLQLPH